MLKCLLANKTVTEKLRLQRVEVDELTFVKHTIIVSELKLFVFQAD